MKTRATTTKILASFLSGTLFVTQCVFSHASETNFWKDRQRAQKDSLQLASLPLELPQLHVPSAVVTAKKFSLPKNAAPQIASLLSAIPAQFGTVRKVMAQKNGSGKTLLHIQDIHRNTEAQQNIGGAVQALIEKKAIGRLALEGAFDQIDLSAFKNYRDQAAVKDGADYLLDTHEISGPVHAALTANGTTIISGIDDRTHYDANVEAYRRSTKEVALVKEILSQEARNLSDAKRKAFSPELAAFDARVEAYRAGTIGLGDYLKSFKASDKESVRRFQEALELEASINFNRVEAERASLVEKLVRTLSPAQTQDLVNATVAFRSGAIRHADFYDHLKKICSNAGLSLAAYPAMEKYVRYVVLADSIDVEAVLAETANLEESAYASLAKTTDEKKLIASSKALHLTQKLVNFELTTDEWQEYKQLVLSNQFSVLSGKLRTNELRTENFEKFYREAEIRDHQMAENVLRTNELRTENPNNVVVLVTGGFHSKGIDQRLYAAGWNVVSFTPKISKVEDQGTSYLSVFTQEKTPLENLIKGEKLFLADNPAASPPQIAVPVLLSQEIQTRQPDVTAADANALAGDNTTIQTKDTEDGATATVTTKNGTVEARIRPQPKGGNGESRKGGGRLSLLGSKITQRNVWKASLIAATLLVSFIGFLENKGYAMHGAARQVQNAAQQHGVWDWLFWLSIGGIVVAAVYDVMSRRGGDEDKFDFDRDLPIKWKNPDYQDQFDAAKAVEVAQNQLRNFSKSPDFRQLMKLCAEAIARDGYELEIVLGERYSMDVFDKTVTMTLVDPRDDRGGRVAFTNAAMFGFVDAAAEMTGRISNMEAGDGLREIDGGLSFYRAVSMESARMALIKDLKLRGFASLFNMGIQKMYLEGIASNAFKGDVYRVAWGYAMAIIARAPVMEMIGEETQGFDEDVEALFGFPGNGGEEAQIPMKVKELTLKAAERIGALPHDADYQSNLYHEYMGLIFDFNAIGLAPASARPNKLNMETGELQGPHYLKFGRGTNRGNEGDGDAQPQFVANGGFIGRFLHDRIYKPTQAQLMKKGMPEKLAWKMVVTKTAPRVETYFLIPAAVAALVIGFYFGYPLAWIISMFTVLSMALFLSSKYVHENFYRGQLQHLPNGNDRAKALMEFYLDGVLFLIPVYLLVGAKEIFLQQVHFRSLTESEVIAYWAIGGIALMIGFALASWNHRRSNRQAWEYGLALNTANAGSERESTPQERELKAQIQLVSKTEYDLFEVHLEPAVETTKVSQGPRVEQQGNTWVIIVPEVVYEYLHPAERHTPDMKQSMVRSAKDQLAKAYRNLLAAQARQKIKNYIDKDSSVQRHLRSGGAVLGFKVEIKDGVYAEGQRPTEDGDRYTFVLGPKFVEVLFNKQDPAHDNARNDFRPTFMDFLEASGVRKESAPSTASVAQKPSKFQRIDRVRLVEDDIAAQLGPVPVVKKPAKPSTTRTVALAIIAALALIITTVFVATGFRNKAPEPDQQKQEQVVKKDNAADAEKKPAEVNKDEAELPDLDSPDVPVKKNTNNDTVAPLKPVKPMPVPQERNTLKAQRVLDDFYTIKETLTTGEVRILSGMPGIVLHQTPLDAFGERVHIDQINNTGNVAYTISSLLPRGGIGIDREKYDLLVKLANDPNAVTPEGDADLFKGKPYMSYNWAIANDEHLDILGQFVDWGWEVNDSQFLAGVYDLVGYRVANGIRENPEEPSIRLLKKLGQKPGFLGLYVLNESNYRPLQNNPISYRDADVILGKVKAAIANDNDTIVLGLALNKMTPEITDEVSQMSHVDIIGFTVYDLLPADAITQLRIYQKRFAPRPVIVTEYGVDANDPDRFNKMLAYVLAFTSTPDDPLRVPAISFAYSWQTQEFLKTLEGVWQWGISEDPKLKAAYLAEINKYQKMTEEQADAAYKKLRAAVEKGVAPSALQANARTAIVESNGYYPPRQQPTDPLLNYHASMFDLKAVSPLVQSQPFTGFVIDPTMGRDAELILKRQKDYQRMQGFHVDYKGPGGVQAMSIFFLDKEGKGEWKTYQVDRASKKVVEVPGLGTFDKKTGVVDISPAKVKEALQKAGFGLELTSVHFSAGEILVQDGVEVQMNPSGTIDSFGWVNYYTSPTKMVKKPIEFLEDKGAAKPATVQNEAPKGTDIWFGGTDGQTSEGGNLVKWRDFKKPIRLKAGQKVTAKFNLRHAKRIGIRFQDVVTDEEKKANPEKKNDGVKGFIHVVEIDQEGDNTVEITIPRDMTIDRISWHYGKGKAWDEVLNKLDTGRLDVESVRAEKTEERSELNLKTGVIGDISEPRERETKNAAVGFVPMMLAAVFTAAMGGDDAGQRFFDAWNAEFPDWNLAQFGIARVKVVPAQNPNAPLTFSIKANEKELIIDARLVQVYGTPEHPKRPMAIGSIKKNLSPQRFEAEVAAARAVKEAEDPTRTVVPEKPQAKKKRVAAPAPAAKQPAVAKASAKPAFTWRSLLSIAAILGSLTVLIFWLVQFRPFEREGAKPDQVQQQEKQEEDKKPVPVNDNKAADDGKKPVEPPKKNVPNVPKNNGAKKPVNDGRAVPQDHVSARAVAHPNGTRVLEITNVTGEKDYLSGAVGANYPMGIDRAVLQRLLQAGDYKSIYQSLSTQAKQLKAMGHIVLQTVPMSGISPEQAAAVDEIYTAVHKEHGIMFVVQTGKTTEKSADENANGLVAAFGNRPWLLAFSIPKVAVPDAEALKGVERMAGILKGADRAVMFNVTGPIAPHLAEELGKLKDVSIVALEIRNGETPEQIKEYLRTLGLANKMLSVDGMVIDPSDPEAAKRVKDYLDVVTAADAGEPAPAVFALFSPKFDLVNTPTETAISERAAAVNKGILPRDKAKDWPADKPAVKVTAPSKTTPAVTEKKTAPFAKPHPDQAYTNGVYAQLDNDDSNRLREQDYAKAAFGKGIGAVKGFVLDVKDSEEGSLPVFFEDTIDGWRAYTIDESGEETVLDASKASFNPATGEAIVQGMGYGKLKGALSVHLLSASTRFNKMWADNPSDAFKPMMADITLSSTGNGKTATTATPNKATTGDSGFNNVGIDLTDKKNENPPKIGHYQSDDKTAKVEFSIWDKKSIPVKKGDKVAVTYEATNINALRTFFFQTGEDVNQAAKLSVDTNNANKKNTVEFIAPVDLDMASLSINYGTKVYGDSNTPLKDNNIDGKLTIKKIEIFKPTAPKKEDKKDDKSTSSIDQKTGSLLSRIPAPVKMGAAAFGFLAVGLGATGMTFVGLLLFFGAIVAIIFAAKFVWTHRAMLLKPALALGLIIGSFAVSTGPTQAQGPGGAAVLVREDVAQKVTRTFSDQYDGGKSTYVLLSEKESKAILAQNEYRLSFNERAVFDKWEGGRIGMQTPEQSKAQKGEFFYEIYVEKRMGGGWNIYWKNGDQKMVYEGARVDRAKMPLIVPMSGVKAALAESKGPSIASIHMAETTQTGFLALAGKVEFKVGLNEPVVPNSAVGKLKGRSIKGDLAKPERFQGDTWRVVQYKAAKSIKVEDGDVIRVEVEMAEKVDNAALEVRVLFEGDKDDEVRAKQVFSLNQKSSIDYHVMLPDGVKPGEKRNIGRLVFSQVSVDGKFPGDPNVTDASLIAKKAHVTAEDKDQKAKEAREKEKKANRKTSMLSAPANEPVKAGMPAFLAAGLLVGALAGAKARRLTPAQLEAVNGINGGLNATSTTLGVHDVTLLRREMRGRLAPSFQNHRYSPSDRNTIVLNTVAPAAEEMSDLASNTTTILALNDSSDAEFALNSQVGTIAIENHAKFKGEGQVRAVIVVQEGRLADALKAEVTKLKAEKIVRVVETAASAVFNGDAMNVPALSRTVRARASDMLLGLTRLEYRENVRPDFGSTLDDMESLFRQAEIRVIDAALQAHPMTAEGGVVGEVMRSVLDDLSA